MCTVYIHRQHLMRLTALRKCSLHGNIAQENMFCLVCELGSMFVSPGQQIKKTVYIVHLDNDCYWAFLSLSPFNNGNSNFVHLSDDKFVPMRPKNTQMANNKQTF